MLRSNAMLTIDDEKYTPLKEEGKWLMVRLVNEDENYDDDPLFSIITGYDCGEYTEKEDFEHLDDAYVAFSWKPVLDK